MPRKLTPERAHENAISRGFMPLEAYPGLRRNWRCIRTQCGHEVNAKYEYIQQGIQGCRVCSGLSVLAGFNDLASQLPSLAAQADGWDPTTVTAKSGKRMGWRCALNHSWTAQIASRANGSGCPICSGHTVQVGFNDLKTRFPVIASQADGWDPSVVNPGSDSKRPWICSEGHRWTASVVKRTSSGHGCPFCSNNQVLVGYNDLKTKFPEIASQAYGWDPSMVSSKSKKKLEWICSEGHTWSAVVSSRTSDGNGCPVCGNRLTVPGINDLATLFPYLAEQADGWDPATVNWGSNRRLPWKCELGHRWVTRVYVRASRNSGCPFCNRDIVLAGFNDLATTHPDVAAMAHGWDPTTVIAGTHKVREWKCPRGHISKAKVQTRARGVGCPYCSNLFIEKGFNDLATTHPDVASMAHGWDPTTVIAGSHKKYRWKCTEGHEWAASPKHLAYSGRGCPSCSKYGFTPSREGWLYFLRHPDRDLFQIGISNSPGDRIRKHELSGWELIELRGPMEGGLAQQLERDSLKVLARRGARFANEVGLEKFDGYTEAWTKSSLIVTSIAQIINWVYEDDTK
jgi:hypothetical protein